MIQEDGVLLGHETLASQFKEFVQDGALAHGYVFYGQEGIGKRSFAVGLARYMEEGVFSPALLRPLSDLLVIAPDDLEKSIGVDSVRVIKRFLSQHPKENSRRTIVIDSAELLTPQAENALLKITEEPSPSALIILVASDPEELLPTLRSRFQAIYFASLKVDVVSKLLSDAFDVPAKDAKIVAERSFGRPGLALRLLRNEKFQKLIFAGEAFLKPKNLTARKIIIAELLEDETFNMDTFLEALMIAGYSSMRDNPAFWHATLSLRREARRFGLNNKLQLTALGRTVESMQ